MLAPIASLGLPGIIDIHTHFMPQRVLEKVWAYFDAVGPMTGRPWPITYRGTEDERLATLRGFGVRAFTSLCYPHKPGMAAYLNDWCADFADTNPDCLRSATFYPEAGAGAYVREAIARGVRVFKSHLQVGEYDPNDRLLDEVWADIERAGVPVVIHAGSGPAPGTFTGPEGIRRLLRRYPELTLVIAHMGAPEYAEFLALCAEYERVHLDTTIAFTDFTEQMHPYPKALHAQLTELGDKIIFGSDFPNIPYAYRHAVDSIIDLGLGDDWSRKVLYQNAANMFDYA